MNRTPGYAILGLAAVCGMGASLARDGALEDGVACVPLNPLLRQDLLVATVFLAIVGGYVVVVGSLLARTDDERRRHDIRSLLRFVFSVVAVVGVLGVLTRPYLGFPFPLGIVGFAVTFALQQPLFSLIGWIYSMVKRPYGVGGRVAIEGSKGDVVEVDFLVTKL